MLMRRAMLIVAALAALCVPAWAQSPFVRVAASVTLAVSNVSSTVAIGTSSRISTLWLCNTGNVAAYIFFGDSTVVATTTGTIVPAGLCGNISPDGKTNIAAITASGTTSLTITPGAGILFGAGGGGGGGTATLGNNADGQAAVSTGLSGVDSYCYLWNGATWDRCQGLTAGTFGTPSTQVLSVQNNDPCSYAAKSSVPISITSATTTSLVAISGTTSIYVCGYSFTIAPSATAADTIQFEYGTGATCGTGTQTLSGTYGNGDLTSAAPVVHVGYGGGSQTVFPTPSAQRLCALTAGTAVNVQGVLTYVQQ